MAELEECIFCKVARGKLPAYILYKDDHVVAFHDINPQAPVHVLIVPIKHIPDLETAAEEDAAVPHRCSGEGAPRRGSLFYFTLPGT